MTPTVAVLTIFLVTCAALITLVFAKPSVVIGGKKISIFWLAPLCGAVALTVSGLLTPAEIAAGLTGAGDVNPIKILLLFFSMTMMSVYLDEIGFFRLLAHKVLGRAKGSQTTLFFLLYALVSVLTVFTSNDIIVLTFTPFICHFAKSARIDPLPYLVSEFVAANTWSMALIIGNPTNIYLMSGTGVSFLAYTARMILPTLLAGLVSLGVLYLLFRKKLKAPLNPEDSPAPVVDIPTAIKAKGNIIEAGRVRKPVAEMYEPFFVLDASGAVWANCVNTVAPSAVKVEILNVKYHTATYIKPGGGLSSHNDVKRCVTVDIPAAPGERYRITGSAVWGGAIYAVYNQDGGVEEVRTGANTENGECLIDHEITMPANTAYFRVSFNQTKYPDQFAVKKLTGIS